MKAATIEIFFHETSNSKAHTICFKLHATKNKNKDKRSS